MMKTRIVSSYGRRGSSSRVRLYDWMDHLGADFNEMNYVDSADNSLSTLARRPLDVVMAELRLRKTRGLEAERVILSRKASPFSNGSVEAGLMRRAGLGVYDFDDSVMTMPKHGAQRIWSTARAWQASVEAADVVIAGNDYLANWAEEINRNVVVIPSCVELRDYAPKKDYALNLPTIVWIGSPSTEKYLLDIAPALLKLHQETGARLRIISSGQASLATLDSMIDRVDWHPDTYADALSTADVGIMPLPDNEWTRGKCAYKLLQYGASALPMIGSPVGANIGVLQASSAPSPSTITEWYDALLDVVRMPTEKRKTLGEFAFSVIRDNYSFDAWKTSWMRATALNS
jgi:glycosyltransferase involved in cell wall biosynthesis